jgi:small subunit ribosomal protein S14
MAKKSAIEKNQRRAAMAQKFGQRRKELKNIANDQSRSVEDRMEARQELAKLPLNSSPVRVRNRCAITGRPHGYLRYFGLSRIAFRDLALKGQLPGVRKGNH